MATSCFTAGWPPPARNCRFEFVILLHFARDDAELNVADLFVCKSLGDQLVDRVAFGQGKCVDLLRAWSL